MEWKKKIKSFLQIQFVTLLLHVFIFTVVWIETACVPILNDNENCACHTMRIDFQANTNERDDEEEEKKNYLKMLWKDRVKFFYYAIIKWLLAHMMENYLHINANNLFKY